MKKFHRLGIIKFWGYADWVKDSINYRLEEFLKVPGGEGLKYMDCSWQSKGSSGSGMCTEAQLSYPPGPNPGPRIIEYRMRDEDGFYKALSAAGVEKEWVTWRDDPVPDLCSGPCQAEPLCAATCEGNYYFMRKNFPRRISDKDRIDMPNPKKIIDEAVPSTNAFKAIEEVKKIGKEHKETKTRDLVLMILTIVFAVVPFAGGAVSFMGGAARIASAALIVGEAGQCGHLHCRDC